MDLSHKYTRLIIDECRAQGLLRNQCAYVLATAWHETGAFKWLRELWGPTAAQKRYEGRKDLGNTQRGDGKRFMGRGFVHITGRWNYTDWAQRTGLDLVGKPEIAEKPEVAVGILVTGMKLGTFTGRKLSDYITLTESSFYGARKIVNGLDRAADIANYAKRFDKLLLAEGYGVESAAQPSRPAPKSEPASKPATKTQPAPKKGVGAVLAAIVALLVAGVLYAIFGG